MDQDDKILLFFKKLRGRLLPQEEEQLRSWTGADPRNRDAGQEVERIWEASGSYKSAYQPDVDRGFGQLRQRIEATDKADPVTSRPTLRWVAAAAAVALVVMSLWWWSDSFRSIGHPELVVVSSKGDQRLVQLPDGSQVVMNQFSTLTYPAVMEGLPARSLTLTGEAYFDVVPDQQQPFRILTERARVEVLGTSFNVRAYPDEPTTEVEVESGRVFFASRQDEEGLSLEANSRGVLGQSGRLYATSAPQLPAHAWRTGTLRLRTIPLREGLQAMERFFGITLALENDEQLGACQLTLGNFQRRELPEALVVLETNFNFKIQAIDSTHFLLKGGACPQ